MSTTFTPPTSYAEDRFYLFWHKLRVPFSIYRQVPIGPYYADFTCLEAALVIEIDGAAYHSTPEQLERDNHRQAYIESQGYRVIRFSASQVYHRPMHCVRRAQSLEEHHLEEAHLPPVPGRTVQLRPEHDIRSRLPRHYRTAQKPVEDIGFYGRWL